MNKPSKKVVRDEIIRLKSVISLVPRTTFFGDNNATSIAAQLNVLEHNSSENDIYNTYEDYVLDNALEARRWLDGDTDNPPSNDWDSLAEITRLQVSDAEKLIGESAETWKSRCHEIAGALLSNQYSPAIGGTLCYGLWHGYISKESPFAGRPMTHHGWIEIGNKILDPTRWVFEGVEPYIYLGPNDHYDNAGQNFAKTRRNGAPKNDPTAKQFKLPKHLEALAKFNGMAGTEIGLPQLMYMANMPPNECTSTVQQNDLAGLHNWLSELNLSGLIPIDYKNIVQQWK